MRVWIGHGIAVHIPSICIGSRDDTFSPRNRTTLTRSHEDLLSSRSVATPLTDRTSVRLLPPTDHHQWAEGHSASSSRRGDAAVGGGLTGESVQETAKWEQRKTRSMVNSQEQGADHHSTHINDLGIADIVI